MRIFAAPDTMKKMDICDYPCMNTKLFDRSNGTPWSQNAKFAHGLVEVAAVPMGPTSLAGSIAP